MSDLQKLVLLGMGGNVLDIIDAVREINALKPTYQLLGYLTRDAKGDEVAGLECLGDYSFARTMPDDVQLVGFDFATSTYTQWPDTIQSIRLPAERYATIVHPRAYVSPQASIGHGSVILAGVTVGARAKIGNWVIILQNVALSHDNMIGDYSCVTSGASFSGGVRLEFNCYVGTNATIVDAARIGKQSLVGAGALIRHDVPAGEIWVGNPGRFLRRVGEPCTAPGAGEPKPDSRNP